MYSVKARRAASLDEQYIEFAARTAGVFREFPQIEPLRLSIFKDLLIHRRSLGWEGQVKRWLRPAIHRSRSMGSLEQCDVLIFVESKREVVVDALIPVYRELTSRGVKVALVSFGGPTDLTFPQITFRYAAVARTPKWAKGAWAGLCGVFDQFAQSDVRESFFYYCAGASALVQECDRILSAVNPKVVVLASTQMAGGAAMIVAARDHACSSLLLQHGILQPFYTPVIADYMLTWGRSSDETMLRLGAPMQKMIPVGSPRHDSMSEVNNSNARREMLESLSLPERPTLAFFSNGNDLTRNGSAPIECATWLERVAAEYADDINVVVRLHPNEDGSLYHDCKHVRVTKNVPNLATTLGGCDWVGSLCSTVLYDALIYRKPVWQFLADGWPELADNWQYGLARRISSEGELSGVINLMLREGPDYSFDGTASEQVFSNQGRATQAVADFIEYSRVGQDSSISEINDKYEGIGRVEVGP